jgi:hypothetical protein
MAVWSVSSSFLDLHFDRTHRVAQSITRVLIQTFTGTFVVGYTSIAMLVLKNHHHSIVDLMIDRLDFPREFRAFMRIVSLRSGNTAILLIITCCIRSIKTVQVWQPQRRDGGRARMLTDAIVPTGTVVVASRPLIGDFIVFHLGPGGDGDEIGRLRNSKFGSVRACCSRSRCRSCRGEIPLSD